MSEKGMPKGEGSTVRTVAESLSDFPAIHALVERQRYEKYIAELSTSICTIVLRSIRGNEAYNQASVRNSDGAYVGELPLYSVGSVSFHAELVTPLDRVAAEETDDYRPTREEDVKTGESCTEILFQLIIDDTDPDTPEVCIPIVNFFRDENGDWNPDTAPEDINEFRYVVEELKRAVLSS